ncbi:MAG: hypothetical protein CL843_05690 [Crocinitomicaceae bacterium]|nr:hypothetical protein [Crocinitomicaceae bacterium]|tara:strand:+ start:8246 stop:8452 length:207 start_codon:yes stop_codon:yes gene_type:complete
MDNNWKLVYASSDSFEVKVIEAKLKESNIECVFFNHQDSEFPNLNTSKLEAGIYVHEDDFENAKSIID